MDPNLLIGLSLIAAAVLLLVAEAFIPSGGIIGIVSLGCAITGIVLLFMVSIGWGVSGLLGTLVLGPVGFFGAANLLPETPMGQRLIGAPSEEEVEAQMLAERDQRAARMALVGQQGRTLTVCRPVGEAQIGDERYEVSAEGAMLEAGEAVRVTHVDRRQIRVRAIDD